MEMSAGDGPKPQDMIENGLKPHLNTNCIEFAKEFVKSLESAERLNVLNVTHNSCTDKLRIVKRQLKDESREIYALERTEQSIYGDKEKVVQAMSEIAQHETQIWDVLSTHINQTAITLAEYKDIQRKYNEERDKGTDLEQHAQKLQDKAANMKSVLQNLQRKKLQLEDERIRLRAKLCPEAFEDRANKLAEFNEKLNQIRPEVNAMKVNLKEKQELMAQHEEQEKLLQKSIEEFQHKFRQSITEMNNLKLQIEERRLDRDKSLMGVQEKVDMVQKFCESVEHDFRNSLSAEIENINSEIMSNQQKNSCLEENFNARCDKQRDLDNEMVKVKASLWQEMDHVKTNISKEVTQKRDLIAEKRKILAKLKRKLNEQKEKQIKESIARPIRGNSVKKPRLEFKKPTSQPISNRLLLTNTLFDQLRTKPLSQRTARSRMNLMNPAAQTEADSISETSVMTMSSIEDLSVLGSRL